MSTEKIGPSDPITEGWRALELFTDRYQAIHLFLSYLNEDPPREQILFFYGGGGNGKSLLLRFLRQHGCKRLRPEDWKWWSKMAEGEAFTEYLKKAKSVEPVPVADLDFGMQPRGDDRPQEAFLALLMLRRDLAGHGLQFLLFDYACVWYLSKTHQLTEERFRSLFPAEEFEVIVQSVDFISKIPGVELIGAGISFLSKYVGKHLGLREKFTLYWQRRGLDAAQVETIQRMDPKSELIDNLPELFALDLNASLSLEGAPRRVVLFFDAHEAFWGSEERSFSRAHFFQQDEWLRRLLRTLDPGIVKVVAGRESPRWAEANRFPIPAGDIDPHLVGHLSEADATRYLERAGIVEGAMRQALVAYARVAPNEVHPLYLGLCADVVLAASKKGMILTPKDFSVVPELAQKGAELIDRLLSSVGPEIDYAVRALSACRAFDQGVYFELGRGLHFQATKPAFDELTRFSFVWRAERRGELPRPEGWYRIHDLLRRLIRERDEEVVRQADQVLEGYYRERGEAGEVTAVAEAIYHANRLDWERGVDEWVKVFEEALEWSRYEQCRVLLEVRSELSIETDFWRGQVSQSEGDYFAPLARHDPANQAYLEAISAYDEALRRAPDDVAAHNNKGNALVRLGDLQAGLSQHPEAVASYTQAISAFDEALRRAPDYINAHNNKGNALQSLGELQVELEQYEEARKSLQAALVEFSRSLEIAPRDERIRARRDQLRRMIDEKLGNRDYETNRRYSQTRPTS
jgi:tetratricopeptide (TPR) repeat protein